MRDPALRAKVIERTASVLREVYRDAPDGVREDVAALGVALTAGDVSPMSAMARLGAMLWERWPAGFDSAARVMPTWAAVARGA